MKSLQIFPYLKEFRPPTKKNASVRVQKSHGERASPSERTNEHSSHEKKEAEKVKDEQKKNNIELDALVTSSQIPLYTLSAVFPFDFFPDQISIEASQVNFMIKSFYFTYQIQSIPVKNIADVYLQTSPFFASLKIIDSSYIENSVQVDHLRKSEASIARRIIQGLVIASKQGLDINGLPPKQLVQKLEQLGHARDVDLIR
jgi:hypothetical protein